MQLIEAALALFVSIQLILLFIKKKDKQVFAFIGLGLLAFHFILGEGRWQMAFIYLVEIILIIIYLRNVKTKIVWRVVGTFFALIGTAASVILSTTLPVFSLPESSGPYQVGRSELYIKVDNRPETITDNATDKRELMINLWYPTKVTDATNGKYLPAVEREGFALKYGLPAGAFSYLDKVSTNHQINAEPAKGEFPVLIFSPGFYTPASGYLSVIEELVSHGFVVFNLITPYETMGIEYPDGRKVYFDHAFHNANSWNWNDEVAEAMETFQNAPDDQTAREATQIIVNNYGADIVKRWAMDITNLIDELPALNSNTSFPLAGKLNLNQLATYGHSIGGAAAMEAAIFDERIKAAVNLDGSQWGSLMNNPLNKPGALISSSLTNAIPDVNPFIFEASLGSTFYNLKLENTGHSNFSDIPYMVRLPQLNEAGSLAPEKATYTVNKFLLNFFNKHLLNENIDLRNIIANDDYLTMRNKD
ncbi:alpha/beta hydrolase family protein [Roseivirga misakiensis]|uniref:Platelet-activating factor acetylhydrolase n=1 Tax=Roseivirga misakiensis TaxID=1563681 RepID=A0A1E5SZ55_9BACT|nr:hypothetical protein [Roseivirga misakiensis]OEK04401.1 hypothetical protein BFP71_13045 [Roseivirga misakiensis]